MARQRAVRNCDHALPPIWVSIGAVVACSAAVGFACIRWLPPLLPSAHPHHMPPHEIDSITHEVCGMYKSFAQMSGSLPAEVTIYTILGMDTPCLSGDDEDATYSSMVSRVRGVYGDAVGSASRAMNLAGDPCRATQDGERALWPTVTSGPSGGSRIERDRLGLVARASNIISNKQSWKLYNTVFGEANCDSSKSHGRRKEAVGQICAAHWNN